MIDPTDYTEKLKEHFYARTGIDNIEVVRMVGGKYIITIRYIDEEIESYLEDGFTISIFIDYIDEDTEDNSIGFIPQLIECKAPSLYIDKDNDNYYMHAYIYSEVARALESAMNNLEFDTEIWLSV